MVLNLHYHHGQDHDGWAWIFFKDPMALYPSHLAGWLRWETAQMLRVMSSLCWDLMRFAKTLKITSRFSLVLELALL